MTEYNKEYFSGERALFQLNDAKITDCIFNDGESPLKESSNIELSGCSFRWRYPLWYAKNVTADNCLWFGTARAGVWYTDNITVTNALVQSPKSFRRCSGVKFDNVTFTNAEETLWHCNNIEMKNVTAKGEYFAMNSRDIFADGFRIDGSYSFDGCSNVEIHNAQMMTKDIFWNCENVTVYDSYISAEYIGWNSKNLTFVNCTIESLQGFCRIQNLKIKNCRLLNTSLAFEYSDVDAEISGKIDSILNPAGGRIKADEIGELIIEDGRVNPSETEINGNILKKSDKPEWIE